MVTVALVAFFGLAVSGVFDTQGLLAHYKLKGAARDLALNMQKARMNAVKENKSWGILFDPVMNMYKFQYFDNSIAPNGAWVDSPDPSVNLLNNYKSGIVFGHGNATVTVPGGIFAGNVTFLNNRAAFTPKGISPTSGYCYIANAVGDTIAVTAQTSGVIKTREWKRNSWQ